MPRYYTINQPGVGYIVAQLSEGDGYIGNRYVRCFGDRQSDAFEFRNDCNAGRIDPRRIAYMCDTYTDVPYRYYGKGRLCRQSGQLY